MPNAIVRIKRNAGASAPPAGRARARKQRQPTKAKSDLRRLADQWREALSVYRAADRAQHDLEKSFVEPAPSRALRARKGDRLLGLDAPIGTFHDYEAIRGLWDRLFVSSWAGRQPLLARAREIVGAVRQQWRDRERLQVRHGISGAARRSARAQDRLSELANEIASQRPGDFDDLLAKVEIIAAACGRDGFGEGDVTAPQLILAALPDDLAALKAVRRKVRNDRR